jgi:hypothetical protein
MAKRKAKIKTRTVYIREMKDTDITPKLKAEIEELEIKKDKAIEGKKGFRKFLAGAAYNKEIGERRRFLRENTQLRTLKQRAEMERAKFDIAKVRGERVDFNKKSSLRLEDLY